MLHQIRGGKKKKKRHWNKRNEFRNFRGKAEVEKEETKWGGSGDRCSPQGEALLTRQWHKLFCSFRLHSKVVELGYKIISQATCLSSLTVQLANWGEWFPVWATIQNMAVKIWMIWRLPPPPTPTLSLLLSHLLPLLSFYKYSVFSPIYRQTNCSWVQVLMVWLTVYKLLINKQSIKGSISPGIFWEWT